MGPISVPVDVCPRCDQPHPVTFAVPYQDARPGQQVFEARCPVSGQPIITWFMPVDQLLAVADTWRNAIPREARR